jgi:hypothetical protein
MRELLIQNSSLARSLFTYVRRRPSWPRARHAAGDQAFPAAASPRRVPLSGTGCAVRGHTMVGPPATSWTAALSRSVPPPENSIRRITIGRLSGFPPRPCMGEASRWRRPHGLAHVAGGGPRVRGRVKRGTRTRVGSERVDRARRIDLAAAGGCPSSLTHRSIL